MGIEVEPTKAVFPRRALSRSSVHPRFASRGVTLVETIVAIGIVITAMNILAQLVVQGMDQSTKA